MLYLTITDVIPQMFSADDSACVALANTRYRGDVSDIGVSFFLCWHTQNAAFSSVEMV